VIIPRCEFDILMGEHYGFLVLSKIETVKLQLL